MGCHPLLQEIFPTQGLNPGSICQSSLLCSLMQHEISLLLLTPNLDFPICSID